MTTNREKLLKKLIMGMFANSSMMHPDVIVNNANETITNLDDKDDDLVEIVVEIIISQGSKINFNDAVANAERILDYYNEFIDQKNKK